MVVDGLPAEFVLGRDGSPPAYSMIEAMPYTHYLLSNGIATGFHAKAAPPTVTMPRLKALVSGAISGFLDVAFNFNTQAFEDDNLLEQLHRIGWKILMFGDETWIKLFPGLFTRCDGVSSFYVKDTTEVDYNVSRHLEVELVADDWDLMILHYLGLDHAGHIAGRYSTLMNLKLKEMDGIIKMLHMSANLQENPVNKHTLLVVLSDHGMTSSGNHGGSSFEETDSLAMFIHLNGKMAVSASDKYKTVNQVDVVPTLALLLGVPIPQNNVGILIADMFNSLTDEQKLRALELSSWQLLRLVQTHFPKLPCGGHLCSESIQEDTGDCDDSFEAKICCLFRKAAVLHRSWKSLNVSAADSSRVQHASAAYFQFLRVSSEWLSRKTTDKPLKTLGSGIFVMVVSSSILFILLIKLCNESTLQTLNCCSQESDYCKGRLVESFTAIGILIHVFSLGASSMVEEEQYIWHFLTSTLYILFLHRAVQFLPGRTAPFIENQRHTFDSNNYFAWFFKSHLLPWLYANEVFQILLIIMVLISGRVLRGWHQGGVNWASLPDISKWLEQRSTFAVRLVETVSMVLLVILGSFCYSRVKLRTPFFGLVRLLVYVSGLLVLLCKASYEKQTSIGSHHWGTFIAQVIYATVISVTLVMALVSPWTIPIANRGTSLGPSSTTLPGLPAWFHHVAAKDCLYSIGCTFVIYWCLLQLLLQQPENSGPILLLLSQLLASINYFSTAGTHNKRWIEVSALYFLGMAGHFGLGNTNTLATVDVAGAYMGLSSYSAVLTGILSFMITYASMLLFLLGLLIYISLRDIDMLPLENVDLGSFLKSMMGLPCLVPLSLNSIVLVAFTVVLLIMRNHLFVWSVFSPKYLYVCATTVCVWVGVSIIAGTGAYSCLVIFVRSKRLHLNTR
ncbi:GPI ethanolamine phosphate transferase 2 isoform X2 [Nymphaea colorata]|nr:GPI ethanolamine phosphate transferase 2 isoform X2 [Nymphaea colorata]XP_049936103.1 GPI ethanolamine phosphate transferase 2 isoform X2 [Nymphaea colorata]XP_049936104.1 GPI ethanolamine phosphate transferase 2 isoform X2 [Nymphaea colorata]